MSTHLWMDEEMWYIYNGITFSCEEKLNPFAGKWMELETIMLSRSRPDSETKRFLVFVAPRFEKIGV